MKKILYALLAFTLGAACCACNDDDDPVVVASELEITPPNWFLSIIQLNHR